MKVYLILIMVGVLSMTACKNDKTYTSGTEACDPNQVYFENDVLPIINSNCAKSGCHDATSHVEGLDLTSYNGILSIVKKNKPSSSKIIEVMEDTGDDMMPPAPNSPVSASDINIIKQWISAGAPNSKCQDSISCNSNNMSFATDITPIINQNCVGCHSSSSPSGNVLLDSYNGVKAQATNGKLYSVITYTGGIVMPPSYKLNTCDIAKIKSWIDAGALNN